jgi:opacity protein-like surface antigen
LAPSHSRFIFHFPNSLFRWITVAAFLATISGTLAAQDQAVNAHTSKGKSSSAIDVSLGIFGQLTPTRTPTEITPFRNGIAYDQTTQGTSISAGFLGTFHQSFRPWLGYNVNFGYSRFSEKYSQGMYFPNPTAPTNPISSFSYGAIGTNMYELTGASVVQGPKAKRIDTFAQLGGGILTFLPTQDPSPYAVQSRPTMVFGAGLNYKLSKQWGLRAEYRGLFLKNPDFHGEGSSSVPISKLFTVTNEPTISIVYRFGGKR